MRSLLLLPLVLCSGCAGTLVGAAVGDAAADRAERPGFQPFTETAEVLPPEQRLDLRLANGEVVTVQAQSLTVRPDSVFAGPLRLVRHEVTGMQVLRPRPGYVVWGTMVGMLVDTALCMRFCDFRIHTSGMFSGLF